MPKKRVKFPIYIQMIGDAKIDVPDGVEDYKDIIKYIEEHSDETEANLEFNEFKYLEDSIEFDPDCDVDIYYYPTKEEEMELDGMKYRLIKKCGGRCTTIDHGMSYDCSIYPLCKRHEISLYSKPNGNIKNYIDRFEPYEIRDAYADIDAPFSGDLMSYDRKRKRIKEYCDHKDFLHCNIIGICSRHNCSRSKDCYDITEDLKYKWNHNDIDKAIEIINKEKKGDE